MSFTGKTACQLVDEKIVLEAKKILMHRHLEIKEIAWQLGYEDTILADCSKKLKEFLQKNIDKW